MLRTAIAWTYQPTFAPRNVATSGGPMRLAAATRVTPAT